MIKAMRSAVLAVMLAAISLFAAAENSASTTTVMVYMCGSSLESDYGCAYGDIMEMLRADYDTERVNVVIMAGGTKHWSTPLMDAEHTYILRLARPRAGSAVNMLFKEKLAPMNMGDAATLGYFLDYAKAEFPADRYALILWNHGAGPAQGLCLDEVFDGDALTLNELEAALGGSPFADEPLEWIGFDACLMCTAETAAKAAPYSRYMIASEETEPGSGWDYGFLNGLEDDPDGAATGKRIVDGYFESLRGSAADLTMSCLDLAGMPRLESAMDELYTAIARELDVSTWQRIAALRLPAAEFGKSIPGSGYDLVDIYSLSDCYSGLYPELADGVKSAVDAVVVYNRNNVGGRGGIAAYHPYRNRGVFLGGWKESYDRLMFCAGYTAYINSYGAIMTGEQLIRWNRLGEPIVKYPDDSYAAFSLPISDEMRANIASARLLITAQSISRMEDNAHALIFSTSDVEIGSDGLCAIYDDTCIEIYDNSCIEPLTGPVSYRTTDEGTYLIHFTLEDPDDIRPGLEVTGEYFREEGTNRLLLKRWLVYDELLGMMTERADIDLSAYGRSVFPREYRIPTDNIYGEHEGFFAWQADENVLEGYVISRTQFTPVICGRGNGDILHAMFEITDLQGNVYTSDMTGIYGGVNGISGSLSVYREARDVNDEPKYEIDAIRLMERSAAYAENAYLMLQYTITNTDSRELIFRADKISLNGRRVPKLYTYNIPGTGSKFDSTRAIAPGETRSLTLMLREDVLNQLLPDTVLTGIEVTLFACEIDRNNPGQLYILAYEDHTLETGYPLDLFCPDTAALPPQNVVDAAQSGLYGGISTDSELTVFENSACRVSLAGVYVCEGNIVPLIHAENRTSKAVNLSLFGACVNGGSAAIGSSTSARVQAHNNQAAAFNLQSGAWSGDVFADIMLSAGESRYAYISITPDKSDIGEMRDFSLRMHASCDGLQENSTSDIIIFDYSAEPVRLEKSGSSFAAARPSVRHADDAFDGSAARLTVTNEYPARTPVYSLSFTPPEGTPVTKVYYSILRRVTDDADLARLCLTDSELFNTGHGWLVFMALGWMDISEDGMTAYSDFAGVLPVIRHGELSLPFIPMLHTADGDRLTLSQNGNMLIYESSAFNGVQGAVDYYIDIDINRDSGLAEIRAGKSLGRVAEAGLMAVEHVCLAPLDADTDTLTALVGQTDESLIYRSGIPIQGRTVEIGLDTLDNPEDYVVVFRYKPEDGAARTSAPVPLDSFPVK